ncbi:MAG: FAD-dependent monooxygenase [Steroidobacteraceae bacterium]|nr:FAD-dependent monooxygenase [Steroidobacteraceae bacterium]MDW8258046.1 FAD-dependent monooxygenase [Gammaproteobacteria bacterium]
MSAAAERDDEVLIAGGGPVGAACGALLLRRGLIAAGRVTIVDPRAVPTPPAPPRTAAQALATDLRVFALSRASERILRRCGAWDEIAAAGIEAYDEMRIWHGAVDPRGSQALHFAAAELAEPNLGYIVPNNLLQAALLRAFVEAGGRIVAGAVDSVTIERGDVVAAGRRARLLIGADGAHSQVRRLAGIGAVQGDYEQSAIVANVRSARPHEHTAWQRFLQPGTLALLPLASGECSIVWSLPRAQAEALVQRSAGDFDAELTAASAGVLGLLELASERVVLPLQRLRAERYVAPRCALIGDAAHVVHPLAGQGVNLGLLDAAALVDTVERALARGEDPGAYAALRPYERWRKSETLVMGEAMDLINRFLAVGDDAASSWARRGMAWSGAAPPLRRRFAARALGIAGDLPRAAAETA